MKIGVIGSGAVGKTLARGFAHRSHEVLLGTRHPDEHGDLAPLVAVGSFADAAKFGEVVVFAVRWPGADEAAREAGAANLAGKIVIDTSNPLRFGPAGPAGLDVPAEGSAGQHVAALLPGARVVKAFSIVGAGLMVEPRFAEGKPDMFICGDDEPAKTVVAGLCYDLAYPAFDVGGLDRSAALEALALLWVSLAFSGKAQGHAFKLLRGGTSGAA